MLTGIASKERPQSLVCLCLAAVVGDAIGMGLGDYLSARSEIQYLKKEEERELYEVEFLLEY